MSHFLQLLVEKLPKTQDHDSLCQTLLVVAKSMIFHAFSRNEPLFATFCRRDLRKQKKLTKSSHMQWLSPFQWAWQKSFSGCAGWKSIGKAETIIIWPSNWTEIESGWCPNAICSTYMVSPCTTQAIITIIIELGCTSLKLIENSRRAQGTQIYTTQVNLALSC